MLLFLSLFLLNFHPTSADLTMMIVYATPDSSSTVASETSDSWTDCINNCFSSSTCQMVYRSGDGTKKCVMYDFIGVTTATVSDVTVGDRCAIKVNPDDPTCVEDSATYFGDSLLNLSIIDGKLYIASLTDNVYTFRKG